MAIYPVGSHPGTALRARPENRPGEIYLFLEPEAAAEVIPDLVAPGVSANIRTPVPTLARAPRLEPRLFFVAPAAAAQPVEVPMVVAPGTAARVRRPIARTKEEPRGGEVVFFFDEVVVEVPAVLVQADTGTLVRKGIGRPAHPFGLVSRIAPAVADPVAPAEVVPSLVVAGTAGHVRQPIRRSKEEPRGGEVVFFFDVEEPAQAMPTLVAAGVSGTSRTPVPPLSKRGLRVWPTVTWAIEAAAATTEEVPPLVQADTDRGVRRGVSRATPPFGLRSRIAPAVADPVAPVVEVPALIQAGTSARARRGIGRATYPFGQRSAIILPVADIRPDAPAGLVVAGVDARTRKPITQQSAKQPAPKVARFTPDVVPPEAFPTLVTAGVGSLSRKPQDPLMRVELWLKLRSQIIVGREDPPGIIPDFVAPGINGRTRKPLTQPIAKRPAPQVQAFTPAPSLPDRRAFITSSDRARGVVVSDRAANISASDQ